MRLYFAVVLLLGVIMWGCTAFPENVDDAATQPDEPVLLEDEIGQDAGAHDNVGDRQARQFYGGYGGYRRYGYGGFGYGRRHYGYGGGFGGYGGYGRRFGHGFYG